MKINKKDLLISLISSLLLAAIIALVAINFGVWGNLAYILLVFVMCKGIWSVMCALK